VAKQSVHQRYILPYSSRRTAPTLLLSITFFPTSLDFSQAPTSSLIGFKIRVLSANSIIGLRFTRSGHPRVFYSSLAGTYSLPLHKPTLRRPAHHSRHPITHHSCSDSSSFIYAGSTPVVCYYRFLEIILFLPTTMYKSFGRPFRILFFTLYPHSKLVVALFWDRLSSWHLLCRVYTMTASADRYPFFSGATMVFGRDCILPHFAT